MSQISLYTAFCLGCFGLGVAIADGEYILAFISSAIALSALGLARNEVLFPVTPLVDERMEEELRQLDLQLDEILGDK